MRTMHDSLKGESHATESKAEVKESAEDVAVPVEDLAKHAAKHISNGLTNILTLFKKRHRQHKHLSTAQHKRVNNMLRNMAAHLMQVNTEAMAEKPERTKTAKSQKQQKQNSGDSSKKKMHSGKTKQAKAVKAAAPTSKKKAGKMLAPKPKQKRVNNATAKPQTKKVNTQVKAKDKKVNSAAPKTWAHKGEVAAEQHAMDQHQPEGPSQFGKVPRGAVVSKFIWQTLGKRHRVREETPKTLAELLKNGVSLMNGGRLHFMLRPN